MMNVNFIKQQEKKTHTHRAFRSFLLSSFLSLSVVAKRKVTRCTHVCKAATEKETELGRGRAKIHIKKTER